MTAHTRERRGAVRLPQEGEEEGSETPNSQEAPFRADGAEHWASQRDERPSAKRLWSWIFTTLLLALIGFLLGVMLGGTISL